MSFTGFIKDVETNAHKFEQEIEKLWQHAPSFATVASTTITFTLPILQAVVIATGGPAGPAEAAAVTAVIDKVQLGLLAVKSLATTIGPQPSVKSIVTGAQADLQQLLAAGQVKDATSRNNITLVLNELGALVNAFPTQTAQPSLPSTTDAAADSKSETPATQQPTS